MTSFIKTQQQYSSSNEGEKTQKTFLKKTLIEKLQKLSKKSNIFLTDNIFFLNFI